MQHSGRCAVDTTRDRGIGVQTPRVNLLATDKTVAKLTAFNALKRARDGDQPTLPATLDLLCHLLALQGIDSRQPTHARLIKLDRPRCIFASIVHCGERCTLFKQQYPEFLALDLCHGLLFAGKSDVKAEPAKTKPRAQLHDQSL
jgi:hypothetical protein